MYVFMMQWLKACALESERPSGVSDFTSLSLIVLIYNLLTTLELSTWDYHED